MITAENIRMHEFVGLRAHIRKSCNPQLLKVSGIVLSESKNMLLLQNDSRAKMYPKAGSTWEFEDDAGRYAVNGNEIGKKPHERSKGV